MEKLFNNTQKKILIGESLKECDIIIRSFVIKNKTPIFNIEKATISSLAKSLVLGSNQFLDFTFLDASETQAVFYLFLKNNIKEGSIFEMIPEKSFSFATSNDALDAVNQIRLGLVKKEDKKIFSLINEYEDYLSDNKFLDDVLVIKNAIKLIDEKNEDSTKIMGFGSQLSIHVLPNVTKKLTYLEKIFLEKLVNLNNVKKFDVVFPKEKRNVNSIKVPTYGYSNAIKYIVKEIKDNNLNFNDVEIILNSSSYNNLIKGYFDNYGINYHFANGENIGNENFTAFIVSCLNFLSNHFNIEYLYEIYKNPALKMFVDENGNTLSYAYTKKIKDLKADIKNIKKKIENYPDHCKKFIDELLDIYRPNEKVSEIFKKVLDFACNYTTENSLRYLKEALSKKERLFKFFDNDEFDTFEDKINLINSIISKITITKELINPKETYVEINSINSTFLSRKYNFIVGFSSDEFVLNEVESPFISDEKFDELLDCKNYYVIKAKNGNKELFEHVNDLVSSLNEGNIYYITSVYDSVNFKMLSKSAYYLNIDANELSVFNENNYEIDVVDTDETDNYVYPQTKENIFKVKNKNLSPSSVEMIVNCPLKYIYSRIYEDIELDEQTEKWLKGGEEGSFAHAILEDFFNSVIENNLTEFDENLFMKCYEKVFNETKINLPFSNELIQEAEAKKVQKLCRSYLNRYYSNDENVNKGKYYPIKCELETKFDEGVIFPDNPDYKIHGIIDRADAYVDGNELKIRLVDYKTYSDTSAAEHKKNKTFFQTVLYPCLINAYVNKNYEKIAGLVGNFEKNDNYDVVFIYEMLKQNERIDTFELYDEIKETILNALDKYSKFIEEPTWKNFNLIYTPTFEAKSKFNEGKCSYCPFSKYCRAKMQKGDNQVWIQ